MFFENIHKRNNFHKARRCVIIVEFMKNNVKLNRYKMLRIDNIIVKYEIVVQNFNYFNECVFAHASLFTKARI